jgi:hypothetical protein
MKELFLKLFLEWFMDNHTKNSKNSPIYLTSFNYLSLELELNIVTLSIYQQG